METAQQARSDWRANIKKINNLYDIEPLELLVFLRHQYLQTAKDIFNQTKNMLYINNLHYDIELAENCCEVAELIHTSIEKQTNVAL